MKQNKSYGSDILFLQNMVWLIPEIRAFASACISALRCRFCLGLTILHQKWRHACACFFLIVLLFFRGSLLHLSPTSDVGDFVEDFFCVTLSFLFKRVSYVSFFFRIIILSQMWLIIVVLHSLFFIRMTYAVFIHWGPISGSGFETSKGPHGRSIAPQLVHLSTRLVFILPSAAIRP